MSPLQQLEQPGFQATANCLFSNDNISQEALDSVGNRLAMLGIPFSKTTITAAVQNVGNWVGGTVFVTNDLIAFQMNAVNAKFQTDSTDIILPISEVKKVAFGKMLIIAKTVDVHCLGGILRFRCNGKNNAALLDALESRLLT